MSKLPAIRARELIKVLRQLGFAETRRKGSHSFFSHKDGRTTVVPVHSGETLGKGLLRAILRDIEISVEELNKEGGFTAFSPAWSDCYAQGDTLDEAVNEISAVAASLIELYKEEGLKVPLKKKGSDKST